MLPWLRFLSLPLEPPTSFSVRKDPRLARPKFHAAPASAVACLFVGLSRQQRQSYLWAAAVGGSVPRLRALVDAGVDVDGHNENGQTALVLAAMYGHARAVQVGVDAGVHAVKRGGDGVEMCGGVCVGGI